jgi:hypothetical protein
VSPSSPSSLAGASDASGITPSSGGTLCNGFSFTTSSYGGLIYTVASVSSFWILNSYSSFCSLESLTSFEKNKKKY